jgi:Cu/Ag efflux protein CusF
MIIVNEIQIHIVLNKINVGNDFRIDAQINADDVANVKKCIYHNSIPNINPGMMIIAFAIQAAASIVL